MTGFALTHGPVNDMRPPTQIPVHLLALNKPASPASSSDSALRAAIVNVANYYLWMARAKSPAEMETLIWQSDSIDGADHGESCTAFASLTLEMGARLVGQQSWVTGGTSYPWPLHQWADVRVDPNPDSPNIISIRQDAHAHNRWHPLSDGYQPQPGDWVLFDGHVEVVTKYVGGVLHTIGMDSSAPLRVNAHQYSASLATRGVKGFVNNGDLFSRASEPTTASAGQAALTRGQAPGQPDHTASPRRAAIPSIEAGALIHANDSQAASSSRPARAATTHRAAARQQPGVIASADPVDVSGQLPRKGMAGVAGHANKASRARSARRVDGQRATASGPKTAGTPTIPGVMPDVATAPAHATTAGMAVIPGLQAITGDVTGGPSAPATPFRTRRNVSAASTHVPGTAAQQAFISQVAPGARAAQARYGVPAAVTIAQAIDESGWGQSALAVRDHNLFGIRGTGPAGTDMLPIQEFMNGSWVTITAPFKVYHNLEESIDDHSQLLASDPAYRQAMVSRYVPDAFANALTGVYATDLYYGANLIAIMQLYNLYQYDVSTSPAACPAAAQPDAGPTRGAGHHAQSGQHQVGRGEKHSPDGPQSRPKPAQPGGGNWEEFILDTIGLPLIVNIASNAAYEWLRKPSRHEPSAKFKFSIIGYGKSIVEVLLPDDGEASREVIRIFIQLAGPGKVYKWDDDAVDWRFLYIITSMKPG